MQRKYNLTYFVYALGLAMLVIGVDVHAQIAFVSRVEHNLEIYVMDADGGNPQRLTNHPGDDAYPSWSPDGERIAFMSDREGNKEVYVMDADGGNQRNLTNNPHDDCCPSWFNSTLAVAPAGQKLTMWRRLKGTVR